MYAPCEKEVAKHNNGQERREHEATTPEARATQKPLLSLNRKSLLFADEL